MQNSLDAFLAIEKYLLVKQGVFKNTLVRGPVGYTLDDETRREVDRLFDLVMRCRGRTLIMTQIDLSGRVALVTGGGQGLAQRSRRRCTARGQKWS